MKRTLLALALASASLWLQPNAAHACGGFFCSSTPVDQNAERIIFSIDDQAGTTDMIVQINYQGRDDSFAWLLPVGAVPEHREVFPALAMSSLDAQSGPLFQLPENCNGGGKNGGPGRFVDAGVSLNTPGTNHDVTVYVMETVDAYDVSVIGSENAEATYDWLLQNGYRLSSVMKPYIELYTQQKMLFLALKLTADATTADIKPFKMTLPGTTPTIPLRLTAIAAEPKMSVVAWIFGQQRFEPANAVEVTVPTDQLRWRPYNPNLNNWPELVARQVEANGGRAWAIDQAGPTASLAAAAQSTFVSSQDQYTAQRALTKLLSNRPYVTRLYTRLSPEEMNYDPTFRRSVAADVPRTHALPYVASLCGEDPESKVCDFATCGALGVCAEAMASYDTVVAGCACAPGTTARTTFDPQGAPTIVCQDMRMSFMNPGEIDEAGGVFNDPCVGFSCGDHGHCVSMNLTPTCACDEDYVAIANVDSNGKRATLCVPAMTPVPKGFYNRRPPALAAGMTAGRIVDLPAPVGKTDVGIAATYGDAVPAVPCCKDEPKQSHDGCAVGRVGTAWPWLSLAALALLSRRRRASKVV